MYFTALRGVVHTQGVLSFWRAVNAAQNRGMAEQIVRKAVKYIDQGKESVALNDMGITPDVMQAIKASPGAITRDASGNITGFDLTKVTDITRAEDFAQAVHRGVSQIVQDTFIGERGKWVHNSWLRLMLQFRHFGIVSIEKQWARQAGNHGTATALGMMVGAMSMAFPLHLARVHTAALGTSDPDAYIERNTRLDKMVRASLNYVAMSGLLGDFADAVQTIGRPNEDYGGKARTLLGNTILPSASAVEDIWQGAQDTEEGTDPHKLMQSLPFGRLPWLLPAVEALTGD
jgi:hypothetical protein